MPRLINISNRLPITLSDDGSIAKSSGGLVAALEGLPRGQYDLKWIGWPGGAVEPEKQEGVRHRLESELGCQPVFLSKEEEVQFYEGFSNSSVWPLLHYMTNFMRYEPEWWESYREVNERYAAEALRVARDGDLVWVHDYQLMLVPELLKLKRPGLRVGFFLHTPFPSYEVFRCHPNRVELLAGMLGADQIGFHTFGYMRHFRSAAMRLLGVDTEITRVRHAGRLTSLGVYPIGINAAKFSKGLASEAFAAELRNLRETYGDKRLIVSVERLDYTKGILHRLDAIEAFLETTAEHESLKFLFVSVPSREGVEEYQQLQADVESRVGRINGKYATLRNSPVHFIHGSVKFEQLLALYALADVGLVTPLIDGMNLVAKEYVAAQRDEAGVLVLSEFAGAAEELFNALIVNPYDTRGVARAIGEALAMPVAERRARMRPMRARVMTFDAAAWAKTFIDDLNRFEASIRETGRAEEAVKRVREARAAGKRIGLFLDYDGTLREIEREPQAAFPNAGVRDLLARLQGRDDVDVTIISGRKPEDLEAWLGDYGFGLIAEHGAAIRRPGSMEWEQLDRTVSYAWKEQIARVLQLHEQSTPGSFIEDKRTSLVWHYRKADPEFGEWKAKQVAEELGSLIANDPLEVRHGKKIVEVTSTEVNKGSAVRRIVDEVGGYDLIVVAGDDVTDESMFRLDLPHVISIKVGWEETHAQYRVETPGEFRRLLWTALS